MVKQGLRIAQRLSHYRTSLVAKYLELQSYSKTADYYGVSKGLVYYWVRKFYDANFHWRPLGTPGKPKFYKQELPIVHKAILSWLAIQQVTSLVLC